MNNAPHLHCLEWIDGVWLVLLCIGIGLGTIFGLGCLSCPVLVWSLLSICVGDRCIDQSLNLILSVAGNNVLLRIELYCVLFLLQGSRRYASIA